MEGLVSKLLLQGRHHSAGVQLPPVQEEAGMRSGGGDISRNPFGLGVVRVAPRLVLPKKMHHLGVLTKPEMRVTIFIFQGDVCLTAKLIRQTVVQTNQRTRVNQPCGNTRPENLLMVFDRGLEAAMTEGLSCSKWSPTTNTRLRCKHTGPGNSPF